MGIKLDWEVESEGGWSEVGEDAKVLAARRQRARRIRAILLSALGVALVAGAIIGYRLCVVGQQVRAALESTIAAETLALRIGDRQAFLALQSNVGGWQEIQAKAFDQYQAEGGRVQVSGQIVEMTITADRARVVLRETLDGVDYHVRWFYQRDENGWKHIPPAASFWGQQQQKGSAHFDFHYYEEDEAPVEALIVRMNGWWETACRLTECSGGPARVQVRIEPDPLATVDWAAYNTSCQNTSEIGPLQMSLRFCISRAFHRAQSFSQRASRTRRKAQPGFGLEPASIRRSVGNARASRGSAVHNQLTWAGRATSLQVNLRHCVTSILLPGKSAVCASVFANSRASSQTKMPSPAKSSLLFTLRI